MRNFLFILFLFPQLLSASVLFSDCNTAIDHLIEVNKEWKNYPDEHLDYLINFKSENDRIQFHIEMVYQILNNEVNTELTIKENFNRKLLLDHLLIFGRLKEFPINKNHVHRQPYFVDHLNTHCAVAHLLKCSNENELIQKIQDHQNNAFIKEMKYPELNQWAIANGLSNKELALIQPAYPSHEFVWDSWGDGNGIDGIVNVMKATSDDELLIIGGDFTAIDGVFTNSIIAYNGNDWITLDDGIIGSVNDIAIDENNLIYIGGDLMIDGTKVNVAQWNGTEWIAMTNSANGIIHTIELHQNKLYVGGEFTEINGITTSNLAYYDFSSAMWSTNSAAGNEGVFAVDGIVRDIIVTDLDSMIIGGSFNRTGVLSTEPGINIDTCYNFSFWNGTDWEHKYKDPMIPEVHTLGSDTYNIFIGGNMEEDINLLYHNFFDGWQNLNDISSPQYQYVEDSIVQGFLIFNQRVYAYGSLAPNITIGVVSYNLLPIPISETSPGINSIDGTINSVVEFKNHIYFAGTFTQIEEKEFNGLARTDGTLPSKEIPDLNLTINSTFNQLYITGELTENGQITILNNSGQQLKSMNLGKGFINTQVPLDHLPNGVYYYHFESNGIRQSDKIVVVQ